MPRASLIVVLVALLGIAFPVSSRAVETIGVRASVGGARALALGGGLVAATGVDAAALNPAALAGAPFGALHLDHRAFGSGLARQSGALALRPWPHRDAVVAVRADIVRQAGIAAPEALSGAPRGVPSRSAWRASLAAATGIGHGVTAGAAIGRSRGVPSWDSTPDGFVADAGLAWQRGATRVGVAASGIVLQSGGGSPDWALGASQALLDGRVFCAAQVERTHAEEIEPAGGVEWWAHRIVALRAGGRGGESPTGTGGLGLHWDRVYVDYALSAAKNAGAVHALSLHFDLGTRAPTEVAEKEPKRAPPVSKPVAASEKPKAAPPAVASDEALNAKPVAPTTLPPSPVQSPPATPRVPAPSESKPVVSEDTAPVVPRTAPPATPPAPSAKPAPNVFEPLLPPLPSQGTPAAPAPSAPAKPGAPAAAPKPAPAPPGAPPAVTPPAEDTVPASYRVFAGPYPSLESLASDALRLRAAGFFPEIQRRGDDYLLVLRRGVSRIDAEKSVAEVREKGLRIRYERD